MESNGLCFAAALTSEDTDPPVSIDADMSEL